MPDFPEVPGFYTRHGAITTADMSQCRIAMFNWMANGVFASTAWGTANLALYVPVMVPTPTLATRMGVHNGTVVAGNLDVGIYSEHGTKIISTGSTAQAGTSVVQTVDITDTWLWPGLYYLALASNSTTATFFCSVPTAIRIETSGVQEQTTAFALPSPATLGTKSTRLFAPCISVYTQTVP